MLKIGDRMLLLLQTSSVYIVNLREGESLYGFSPFFITLFGVITLLSLNQSQCICRNFNSETQRMVLDKIENQLVKISICQCFRL